MGVNDTARLCECTEHLLCHKKLFIAVFYDNCVLAHGITSLTTTGHDCHAYCAVPGQVSLRTSTYFYGMTATYLLQSMVARLFLCRTGVRTHDST